MNAGRTGKLLLLPLLVILTLGATTSDTWQLIDRFKNVSVGEWVKLKYSGGSEHLLLVARKDEKAIVLEERVREEGYVTSWTQTVIDLKKKSPVLLREILPTGEIRETAIKKEESGPGEEFHALLTARFSPEPGTQQVIVPAGRFSCTFYRGVYNKKSIRVFISNKIPLYPVKVVIPGYELTIQLVAFGKGMTSRFPPAAETLPEQCPEEGPAAEDK